VNSLKRRYKKTLLTLDPLKSTKNRNLESCEDLEYI
jgi:hypothetical protein